MSISAPLRARSLRAALAALAASPGSPPASGQRFERGGQRQGRERGAILAAARSASISSASWAATRRGRRAPPRPAPGRRRRRSPALRRLAPAPLGQLHGLAPAPVGDLLAGAVAEADRDRVAGLRCRPRRRRGRRRGGRAAPGCTVWAVSSASSAGELVVADHLLRASRGRGCVVEGQIALISVSRLSCSGQRLRLGARAAPACRAAGVERARAAPSVRTTSTSGSALRLRRRAGPGSGRRRARSAPGEVELGEGQQRHRSAEPTRECSGVRGRYSPRWALLDALALGRQRELRGLDRHARLVELADPVEQLVPLLGLEQARVAAAPARRARRPG